MRFAYCRKIVARRAWPRRSARSAAPSHRCASSRGSSALGGEDLLWLFVSATITLTLSASALAGRTKCTARHLGGSFFLTSVRVLVRRSRVTLTGGCPNKRSARWRPIWATSKARRTISSSFDACFADMLENYTASRSVKYSKSIRRENRVWRVCRSVCVPVFPSIAKVFGILSA